MKYYITLIKTLSSTILFTKILKNEYIIHGTIKKKNAKTYVKNEYNTNIQ